MTKAMFKMGLCVVVAVFLASCTMRSYVLEKNRLDQEITGNAGCLSGTCPQTNTGEVRKTRKTYVWEIESGPTKVISEEQQNTTVPETTYSPDEEMMGTGEEAAMPYDEQEMAAPVVQEATFVEYKIEAGDTLQKISKKFYGSYSKWNRIYEANKDVLASPDRIVPGKVIQIPQ